MKCQKLSRLWVFFVISTVFAVLKANIILEGEDGQIIGNRGYISSRRSASSGRTVSIRRGGIVVFQLCVSSKSVLKLNKIIFSNDGYADAFSIAIDGETLFHGTTKSVFLGGKAWNELDSVWPDRIYHLDAGQHQLMFKVEDADYFGMELDCLEVTLDTDIGAEELLCRSQCLEHINYSSKLKHVETTNTIQNSYILQRSVETKCAEEDNINIPIFSENVATVTITAEPPKYFSKDNNRSPDFTNCDMVSAFWMFEDIVFESDETAGDRFHKASVGQKHTKHIHGNVAALIAGINAKKMTVKIFFKMEGRSKGVVDADIGSILLLHFKSISETTMVNIEYIGRDGTLTKGLSRIFDPSVLHQTWNIPDFTWTDNGDNVLLIHIHSASNRAEIERIELFQRHKEPTKFFHMFNDGKYLMEGANIDFWWLVNQTMSVRILDNGDFFTTADYFRIYAKIPWQKDHFTQVFVLYQDGNVRLLPITQPGFDWIPFGSSVLIGSSDPSHERPSAPIRHVDILMDKLRLYIYYVDGTSLTLNILPAMERTVLKIENIELSRDPSQFPLVTFRSMWLSNGNADVDHVASTRKLVPVLSNWDRLYGSSFAFFRKCVSKHNTQSPDILVDISPTDTR